LHHGETLGSTSHSRVFKRTVDAELKVSHNLKLDFI
jgi:hypothetical protein